MPLTCNNASVVVQAVSCRAGSKRRPADSLAVNRQRCRFRCRCRCACGCGEPVLVESLSPRELDVLRLLASELNGPDIARELVLSLNTIRTHTKNIYAKLGVTNRRAAVRRAHELNLLRAHMSR